MQHKTHYTTKRNEKRWNTYVDREKMLSSKSVQNNKIDDQYCDLVIESVKKNYLVGNLKPFAVDANSIIHHFKKEVEGLRQVSPQKNQTVSIYQEIEKPKTPQNKLMVLLQRSKFGKLKKTGRVKTEQFIKSKIEDQYGNLLEDYSQELKQEKQTRQKTIKGINSKLLTKYPSLLEINIQQSSFKNSNKILRFKRKNNFNGATHIYTMGDDIFINSKKNALDVEKDDYGIYSRSTGKAMYMKDNSSTTTEIRQSFRTPKFVQSKYYKKYLGSYTLRRNILRQSQNCLKK